MSAVESSDEIDHVEAASSRSSSDSKETRDQRLCWVNVEDLLRLEPFPPRQEERPLEDLVSSIRIHGVISPVLARPTDTGLQLVCGNRRVLAARAAGARTVPTLVASLGDAEAIRRYLSENVCRRPLDDRRIEDALGLLKRLRDAGEPARYPVARRSASAGGAPSGEEKTVRLDVEEVGRIARRLGADGPPSGRRFAATSGEPQGSRVAAPPSDSTGPARWEIDDLVERTRGFLARLRDTRRVDIGSAEAIVDELIGMQSGGAPLAVERVYDSSAGEGSWLAPHSLLVASINLALWETDARVTPGDPESVAEHVRAGRQVCGLAGLLHDIGMVFFEGKDFFASSRLLAPAERAELRRHTSIGHALLSGLGSGYAEVALAARDHHERPDGSGYPQGLREQGLRPTSRLTALSDAFAALVAPRPYRARRSPGEALETLLRSHGLGACDRERALRLVRLYCGSMTLCGRTVSLERYAAVLRARRGGPAAVAQASL
jgi:hypothetical protein